MSWVALASLTDFDERNVIGVSHENLQIALSQLDSCIYATSDTCPHQYARLSEGEVVGGLIECPAHYALFDIRTGRCEGGVTDRSIATYPVKTEEGRVFVSI